MIPLVNQLSSVHTLAAAFSAVGRQPVGQEDESLRTSTLKPVEQLQESARGAIRSRDGSLNQQDKDQIGSSEPAESSALEDDESSSTAQREKAQLEQDQQEIRSLAARDREVRAHEQAHAAVGGQYAGAPQYQFERGPDGVNYAIAGEVPIDVSKEAQPELTIAKMQVVRRAALAPAEPSPQDRRVAAEATRKESEARGELNIQRREVADESEASSETDDSESSTLRSSGSSRSLESSRADAPSTGIEPGSLASPPVNDLTARANVVSSRLEQSLSFIDSQPRQGRLFDQLA